MTGPPIADGAVLVEGDRIVAVSDRRNLRTTADREHHVDGVLLPGLVNGHTALEHHDLAHLAKPGPHHAWLRAVEHAARSLDREAWMRSAHRGVLASLRSGVTAVMDIVRAGPAVPAAGRAGLLGTSYVEIAWVDAREQDAVITALEASLARPAAGRTVGVAAASPVALSSGALFALSALARKHGAPFRVSAAVSSAEITALRTGEGPLAELATEIGLDAEWLDEPVRTGAVAYLDDVDALHGTLAHGVWVDLSEARRLVEAGVAVVVAPRAANQLKVGDPPLERYAEAGVQLALGTASPAAAGDYDLLAEAAAWVAAARRRDVVFWPAVTGPTPLEEQALRLATVDGARALGLGRVSGILEPGRRADLVGVACPATPQTAYADVLAGGIGRTVLTVLGGVRKARRHDADEAWPPAEDAR